MGRPPQPVRSGEVHAEGDLDFRGTLGVSKEAPVGFRDIRLRFRLETDAGAEELARLEQLTERYCVVPQTLRVAPTVSLETSRVLTPRSRAPGGP